MSFPERAGWYDDPDDETQLRYFDGVVWSEHRVPRQTRTAEPTAAVDPGPARFDQPAQGTPPQVAPGRDVFGRPAGAPATRDEASHQTFAPHPSHAPQPGWGTHVGGAPGQPTSADGRPLAGFGARVAAYLLDGLLVGLLNLLLTGWAWYRWMADYWSFVWDAAMAGDQDAVNGLTPEQMMGFFDWRYFFIASGLSLLLLAVYHVGFVATRNATPGKMAVGLAVASTAPDQRPGPLGVRIAFMRMLLPLALGVLTMVPVVGYLAAFTWLADKLWPLKDQHRQTLHDKIAGTQVVVTRR
jgi:uncharacterized RDD family membrane protein YckC